MMFEVWELRFELNWYPFCRICVCSCQMNRRYFHIDWLHRKHIERHTAHTIVSWPNPKQWIIVHTSFLTSLTLSQWSSSGNPVCLELRPQCTLECHWRNASVLPVVFQCVPIMQINTGTPLGASISQCGSSGIPVYLWLQWSSSVFQLCKLTLGASISQCGSSGIPVYLWLQWSSSAVCPVVSQCTDRIWFGGHWVRSLPSMRPLMYTTAMVRLSSTDFIWLATSNTQKTIMVLISKACTE